MNQPEIRCIIAAANPETGKELAAMIEQQPGCKVDAVFSGRKKLVDYLNKHIPGVAVVDLDLEDLNGYGFLQQVITLPQVIAVASGNSLAADGYKYNVSGYVTKPVAPDTLAAALQKAVARIRAGAAAEIVKPQHPFIFIRAEYKLMRVNFEDILYIEGLKDYSKIYTTPAAGKAIITLQNLKSFEEKLSPDDFIRVHRSYIVSLARIDVIHKNSILIGKHEIPVSDGFRPHLYAAIAKYT